MTYLLDVNLLLALGWEDHEQYFNATKSLEGVSSFATCPITQLGFARISSDPALGFAASPDDAFTVLRDLLSDPRHIFIHDVLSCEDRVVRTDLMRGSKQVTDRYLVALARHFKMTLATFDQNLVHTFRDEPGVLYLVS